MTIEEHPLEIVERTDVFALLEQMPECRTIVTTGGKASEELQAYLLSKGIEAKIPKVGESRPAFCPTTKARLPLKGRESISWWRMPSSSRAYPMKLENKAEYYCRLFE